MVMLDRHATAEERLRATIADMDRLAAEREAWWAERDAWWARYAAESHRQLRIDLWVFAGLIIATMAICTGIVIAVLG